MPLSGYRYICNLNNNYDKDSGNHVKLKLTNQILRIVESYQEADRKNR